MPSPFPGMDPYLEGSLWSTIHTGLSVEIARQLSPKLRPKYLALTTERLVLDIDDSVAISAAEIIPDVSVWRRGEVRTQESVATMVPPLRLPTISPARVSHVTIEIRDVAKRRLVTAIEVLSPTNKRSLGRKEYLRKRSRIFNSSTHLIEIDLLRTGRRVPMRRPLPPLPYFVLVSRVETRPILDVWPIGLLDRLPIVPVPLLNGDADFALDLQAAFTSLYDGLNYDLAVDYSQPPEVPLSAEESALVETVLRER